MHFPEDEVMPNTLHGETPGGNKVVLFPSGRLDQNGIDNGATMIVDSSGNPADPKTQQWLEKTMNRVDREVSSNRSHPI